MRRHFLSLSLASSVALLACGESNSAPGATAAGGSSGGVDSITATGTSTTTAVPTTSGEVTGMSDATTTAGTTTSSEATGMSDATITAGTTTAGTSTDGSTADVTAGSTTDATGPKVPVCGDGVIDEGEACDDGNNDDGDLCNGDCSDFVVIRFKIGGRCLTLVDGGIESTTMCAPDDPGQQWEMFTDGFAFGFRNRANDECLSQSGPLAGPWTVETAPCNGFNEQQWLLETYDQGGFDANFPVRLHNVANDFCAYTDGTGLVYGTAGNCQLAGTESNRKVGLYYGGVFGEPPYQP